jgi:hypothetical protein
MLVGPSGTGKSSAYRFLNHLWRSIVATCIIDHFCRCLLHALDAHTSSVSHVHVIDPKSVKKEDLYGI